MSKILILCEKPSVGKDVARVLKCDIESDINGLKYYENDTFAVSFFRGHLVGLCEPDEYFSHLKNAPENLTKSGKLKWSAVPLPILPQEYKFTANFGCEKHLKSVTKLMNSPQFDSLICATDAGREGELIFRYVYDFANCKKPFKRLWISSLTDESIENGMKNLLDGSAKNSMFSAGDCRNKADWLIGMNLTRFYTSIYGNPAPKTAFSVGRVQTPTLRMIADRDLEIANFKKSKYYTVFLNENAEYFNPDGENIFEKKEVAERLVSELDGKIGTVISVTSKEKSENRPLLHSLTSLQKEANEKHGFTANDTLSALQNLYEKKLTTYPRTDSNYITEDMKNLMPKLVNEVSFFAPERCEKLLENGLNLDKRIVDDKKVTDHHAVLPTTETSKSVNMSLTETEKKVLNLVINRFLTALDNPYIFTETENIFDICGYKFKSVTKLPKSLGWREYEQTKSDKNGDIKPNTEDKIYNQGDSFTAKISVTEKEKSAPKPFTESTLLSAMEHISRKIDDKEKAEFVKERGLGTPATRAGIIEKLVKDGFILRNGKNLNASELGKKIISLLPEEVKSVEMTADMEQKLFEVENEKLSANEYLKDVEEFIKSRISAENGQNHTIFGNNNTPEILGKCPKCGKNVVSFPKSYSCEDRNCDFVIWKEMFGSKITIEDVKNLLERGKTNTKNFKNKAGKAYKARLGLDVNKKIEISFVNSR